MIQPLARLFAKRPIFGILSIFLAIFLIGSGLIVATAIGETRDDFLFPFFTALSALTVTGLVSAPTESLPVAAQVVILILIQLGGLGMVTFFALVVVFVGRRMSLEETATLRFAFDKETMANVWRFMRFFIVGSFVIEMIGTLLIFLSLRASFGDGEALWQALFHSVSAFNNAGFYVLPAGLEAYKQNVLFMGTLVGLVIMGGLGFLTYPVLGSWLYTRIPGKKSTTYFFPVETRLILVGSLALLVLGTLVIFVFQPLSGGLAERIFTAFFFSANARTAGFAVSDVASFAPATLLLIIFFMFIGAAPGSTGGGVKVTTFMLQLLLLRAFLQGREEIIAWQRRIPMILVARSALIIVISLGVVFLGTLALLMLEQAPLERTAFEAFSAFGTVGLSAGGTASYEMPGKIVIMLLMFLGRFGPLTLLYLLMMPREKSTIKFPEAHISLG